MAGRSSSAAFSRRRSSGSALEDEFEQQLRAAGIEGWVREHRFALDIGRRWRLDFAWPVHMVAVEIEGGTAIGGRHTRVIGFREDSHKADAATCLGWRVLRGDAQMLRKGFLLAYLEDALAGCPPRVSGGPKNYRVAR